MGRTCGLGLVALDVLLEVVVDLLLVALVAHVDEVEHDQAADVAQAQLAGDFLHRLEVGLEDGLVLVLAALVAAGVDVDGDERLGLVDDEVAAARQPDLAAHGGVDLLVDVEPFEDGDGLGVVADLALRALGDHADELLHAVGRVEVVDDDAVHLVGEEVAHGALDQVGLGQEELGRAGGLELAGDALPLLEQDVQVAHEEAGLLAFAHGADDDAHALGQVRSRRGCGAGAGVPSGPRSCARCRSGRSRA